MLTVISNSVCDSQNLVVSSEFQTFAHMANLFKPTYTRADPETGKKTTHRLKKWYGKYRDADGVLRRVPLCRDRMAAQAMLNDIIRKVERQVAGLIDKATDELAKPLAGHVDDFRTHLLANARSEKHVTETIRHVQNVTRQCNCRILADLQAAGDQFERYLANRRQSGVSHRTINADLVAVRSFCRWLISRQRMRLDPTSGLTRLNEEEDRRRERKPLSDDEAQRLIETTYRSERLYRKLAGKDRALLYLLAQRTGLRRKELRSLTPRSFQLDCSPPIVRLQAAESKRRKRDVLPLPDDLVPIFAEYLANRPPTLPVWPGSWWRRSAEMLRLDLSDAKIEPVDAEGRVIDFHGQRTTFITSLARAGVTPAAAQKLARHSDINLTLGVYTRLDAQDLTEALRRLPELSPTGSPSTGSRPARSELGKQEDKSPPELAKVVSAWPTLPDHIRQAILALISTAQTPTG